MRIFVFNAQEFPWYKRHGTFMAAKLHQVSNMFETLAISILLDHFQLGCNLTSLYVPEREPRNAERNILSWLFGLHLLRDSFFLVFYFHHDLE